MNAEQVQNKCRITAERVQNERQMQIEKVVQKTRLRGRDYGLPGIPYKVIDDWVQAFNQMDSASSALALEASIHKDDLHEVRAKNPWLVVSQPGAV